jgi:hypothetical protein
MNTDTPRTNDIIDQIKGFRTSSAIYSLEQFSRLLEQELTAVTEQRDRLAEALIKCREDSVCEQVRMEKCRYTKAADESQANIDRADKALQYLNRP